MGLFLYGREHARMHGKLVALLCGEQVVERGWTKSMAGTPGTHELADGCPRTRLLTGCNSTCLGRPLCAGVCGHAHAQLPSVPMQRQ